MAVSPEYLPIPCSSLRVKKADGNFEEQEIKFATTTDLVSDASNNTLLSDTLQTLKDNKCVFVGCTGYFDHELWNNDVLFRGYDDETPDTITRRCGDITKFNLIPLNIDLTYGDYPCIGGIDRYAPIPDFSHKYFQLTDDGGIECLYSGYIEISASAYFIGVSDTFTNLYIHKGKGAVSPNLSTGIIETENQDLYEAFCGSVNSSITGTHSTGRRFLHVDAGDRLYLSIRPNHAAAECMINHRQTGLFVNYLSLD